VAPAVHRRHGRAARDRPLGADDDTIRRLQAFERAGADVVYAPGLRDLAAIRTVVSSVTRPVNVVASSLDPSISVAQLAEAGVKRISVDGSRSRLALAAFLEGGARDEGAGRVHLAAADDPRRGAADALRRAEGMSDPSADPSPVEGAEGLTGRTAEVRDR
jgi:2-methylisocitrate lyase-like PEP mutase family enzyme